MSLTVVNSDNFQQKVLDSPVPVMVDFWAEWCGPCQTVTPILEELAQEYQDKLKIVKLNVDENNELAAKYGVMSIPTFIVFNKADKAGSFVGAMPKEMFVERIDEILTKIPQQS